MSRISQKHNVYVYKGFVDNCLGRALCNELCRTTK